MNDQSVKTSYSAQQLHGVAEVPLSSILAYGEALLAIVGGDGQVTPAEWGYFEDRARGMATPDAVIAHWRAFDFHNADVTAILPVAFDAGVPPKKVARLMLYDAITMSMADGAYSDGERHVAEKAAKWLGVEDVVLRAIEGIVQTERAVARMRLSVFDAA